MCLFFSSYYVFVEGNKFQLDCHRSDNWDGLTEAIIKFILHARTHTQTHNKRITFTLRLQNFQMKGPLTGAEGAFSPSGGSPHRSAAPRSAARLKPPLLGCNCGCEAVVMKARIPRRCAHSPSRGALTLKLRQAGTTLPLPLPLQGGGSQSRGTVLLGKCSSSIAWLILFI